MRGRNGPGSPPTRLLSFSLSISDTCILLHSLANFPPFHLLLLSPPLSPLPSSLPLPLPLPLSRTHTLLLSIPQFDVIPLAKGGLRPETLAAVAELGFTNTTPVQQATIPLLLSNKDVAVQACTGSGKTVAFLIPAFEMVLRCDDPWGKHDVGALVIAPTRELAIQVKNLPASVVACCAYDVADICSRYMKR
jgi:hypothetical protein